jgi:hypothetical protein
MISSAWVFGINGTVNRLKLSSFLDSTKQLHFIVDKWKHVKRFVSASDVNDSLWTAWRRPPSISLMLRSNGPGPSALPINLDYPFGGSPLLRT